MKKENRQPGSGHTTISVWDSSGTGKTLFLQLLEKYIREIYHRDLDICLKTQPFDHFAGCSTSSVPSHNPGGSITWEISRNIKENRRKKNKILMVSNTQYHKIEINEPKGENVDYASQDPMQMDSMQMFRSSDVVVIIVDFNGIFDAEAEARVKAEARWIDLDYARNPEELIDLTKYIKRSRLFLEKIERQKTDKPEKQVEKIEKQKLINFVTQLFSVQGHRIQQCILCMTYEAPPEGTGNNSTKPDLRMLLGNELIQSWEKWPILVGLIHNRKLRLSELKLDENNNEVQQEPTRFLFTILEKKERARIEQLNRNLLQVIFLGGYKRYRKNYKPYYVD